jgi:hypothetical protein
MVAKGDASTKFTNAGLYGVPFPPGLILLICVYLAFNSHTPSMDFN